LCPIRQETLAPAVTGGTSWDDIAEMGGIMREPDTTTLLWASTAVVLGLGPSRETETFLTGLLVVGAATAATGLHHLLVPPAQHD
jgi:hypothetical protein